MAPVLYRWCGTELLLCNDCADVLCTEEWWLWLCALPRLVLCWLWLWCESWRLPLCRLPLPWDPWLCKLAPEPGRLRLWCEEWLDCGRLPPTWPAPAKCCPGAACCPVECRTGSGLLVLPHECCRRCPLLPATGAGTAVLALYGADAHLALNEDECCCWCALWTWPWPALCPCICPWPCTG